MLKICLPSFARCLPRYRSLTFGTTFSDYGVRRNGQLPQGYVNSPWISVQIEMNETEETAYIVLEADHLGDEENPGRQVWNALVYQRGNETLIMNFEASGIDLWDGGIWFCRVFDCRFVPT